MSNVRAQSINMLCVPRAVRPEDGRWPSFPNYFLVLRRAVLSIPVDIVSAGMTSEAPIELDQIPAHSLTLPSEGKDCA